jgi:hypothetical protein
MIVEHMGNFIFISPCVNVTYTSLPAVSVFCHNASCCVLHLTEIVLLFLTYFFTLSFLLYFSSSFWFCKFLSSFTALALLSAHGSTKCLSLFSLLFAFSFVYSYTLSTQLGTSRNSCYMLSVHPILISYLFPMEISVRSLL